MSPRTRGLFSGPATPRNSLPKRENKAQFTIEIKNKITDILRQLFLFSIIFMLSFSSFIITFPTVSATTITTNDDISPWLEVARLDFNETANPWGYFNVWNDSKYDTTITAINGILNITWTGAQVGQARIQKLDWLHKAPEYKLNIRFKTDYNGGGGYVQFTGPSPNVSAPTRFVICEQSIFGYNVIPAAWGAGQNVGSFTKNTWHTLSVLMNTINCTSSYYFDDVYKGISRTPDYDLLTPLSWDFPYRDLFQSWSLLLPGIGVSTYTIWFDWMTQEIPRKLITISTPPMFIMEFDDAALTTYTIAYPLFKNLKLYNKEFSASIEVCLENLNEAPMWRSTQMTWDQLETLYQHGWLLDDHGVWHTAGFTTLSWANVTNQILTAHDSIIANTSQSDVWGISFPGNSYNNSILTFGEQNGMISRHFPRDQIYVLYSNVSTRESDIWVENAAAAGARGSCFFYTHFIRTGSTHEDTYPANFTRIVNALYNNSVLIVSYPFFLYTVANAIDSVISNIDINDDYYSLKIDTNGFPAYVDVYDINNIYHGSSTVITNSLGVQQWYSYDSTNNSFRFWAEDNETYKIDEVVIPPLITPIQRLNQLGPELISLLIWAFYIMIIVSIFASIMVVITRKH